MPGGIWSALPHPALPHPSKLLRRYAYSWSVMSSTVCVVVLEGFKEEETPWKLAGFR